MTAVQNRYSTLEPSDVIHYDSLARGRRVEDDDPYQDWTTEEKFQSNKVCEPLVGYKKQHSLFPLENYSEQSTSVKPLSIKFINFLTLVTQTRLKDRIDYLSIQQKESRAVGGNLT